RAENVYLPSVGTRVLAEDTRHARRLEPAPAAALLAIRDRCHHEGRVELRQRPSASCCRRCSGCRCCGWCCGLRRCLSSHWLLLSASSSSHHANDRHRIYTLTSARRAWNRTSSGPQLADVEMEQ
ncbi:hypothetical protein PMAYCL1PPCAC_27075, partial [Pristionchus mayeri]